MRILFLRHPMHNVGGTGIYTKTMIEELLNRDHTIGLWPTDKMVYKDLLDSPIIGLPFRQKVIDSPWDIIVLQNSQTLRSAHHIISQLAHLPHVFISHSSAPLDQVAPYRQLHHVIMITEGICNTWGIPEEICSVVYNPVSIPSTTTSQKRKSSTRYTVLFISRLDPDRLNLVRDIIMTLNQMPDYRLIIVGGGMDYLAQSIANRNIIFTGEQLDVSGFYNEADIVVGSGRTAVEGMAYCKPVIVAGLRGLGGVVTPENYPRFKKIMFSGRLNGALNEGIPSAGLIASILSAQMRSGMDKIVLTNFQNVSKDFSRKKIVTQFENILQKTIRMHGLIETDASILSMKPLKCSDCQIIRNKEAGLEAIMRRSTGQILGYLDTAGRKILESCDSNHLVSECFPDGIVDRSKYLPDLIATIRKLWYHKMITFKYS